MKIKIIEAYYLKELQKKVNKFLEDKDVINVTINNTGEYDGIYFACILYK